MDSSQLTDVEILIVGSGLSGISSALALCRNGFTDLMILEAADCPGGVWRDNRYPGVACDIPSILYQYRDEKNPDWSKLYVEGDEILEYLREVQDKYGLPQKTRYGVAVQSAVYDESNALWQVTTSEGESLRCRYLIKATGAFNSPKIPSFPGLEDFKGEIFHTAQWPEGLDLSGKRVAVIGTGASAIQLVPLVAECAQQLTVYQRTPIWLLPKPDFSVPSVMRRAFKKLPWLHERYHRLAHKSIGHFLAVALVSSGNHPRFHRALEWAGRWNIRRQLKRPELIRQFTPDYSLGCKRPSFSNNYYRTFEKSNVTLNTSGIEKLTPSGVVTKGGTTAEPFDVIVLATGFNILGEASTSLPAFSITGRGGRDLRHYWHEQVGFKAFRGAAVSGFPNLFLNLGIPYAGGTSWYETADMISAQIVACLKAAQSKKRPIIEVSDAAVDRYMSAMDTMLSESVQRVGNCSGSNSYYYDSKGNNPIYSAERPDVTWAQAIQSVEASYVFSAVESEVVAPESSTKEENPAVGAV
ncbi:cation diffusion facilitator CzcD-associated flavoprotein CzcO [Litorivivens lipolytica]|uniref:Cation diffusion facilitator CzcD-associated flavoprotein CzcO n=1 Tax=Litorivivens lipolytica TaxID=1524264 RepID=A0A7W4W2Q6_9GAMM|nr:NAD(P)/FAD-dependent oxidoreductase [Litorivivens lipolytica]MBB3045839.1 cation diffusion facilitator CzcD-associated flavoprotein CzcO [Litorivivens lipolytica]